jgi:pyruvate dehydrogenase E1 component beta subunit
MSELVTYGEAERLAIKGEMDRDHRVVYLGECVEGRFAGRSFEMPISEGAFTGLGVGAALTGLRPIVEIMFGDFVTVAMDPIVNQAAKMRYMFGGTADVPLVIRCAFGACGGMAAQHTQNLESWFAAVPGLQVVAPGDVADVAGLMRAAIRDDNPVVFCYQRNLSGLKGEMPPADFVVPIGKAAVKRPGRDVTVVSYGETLPKALEAARVIAETGIEAEIVDLRTLLPLDIDTVLESVSHTGRLVVAAGTYAPCSPAGEVLALVAERGFRRLKAPPRRVNLKFAPTPFNNELADHVFIHPADIIAAVNATLAG